jgi:hypothetical protein
MEANMKVRVIGLPRPQDAEPYRQLWLGMELTVIEPDPDNHTASIPNNLYWVDYEEVICQIAEKNKAYAAFFQRMRDSSGGSMAHGLIIDRELCEVIA